jgi:molecular chaperone Hsp33
MKDYLVKAYAFGGLVRIYAARTTELVEEARTIHDTWPAATAAFGRVLTASLIIGAMYKGDIEL